MDLNESHLNHNMLKYNFQHIIRAKAQNTWGLAKMIVKKRCPGRGANLGSFGFRLFSLSKAAP